MPLKRLQIALSGILGVCCLIAGLSLGRAEAQEAATNDPIQVGSQLNLTFQLAPTWMVVDFDNQADCLQTCYVGNLVCIRDKLPAEVSNSSGTSAALEIADSTAVKCGTYIEGYCYGQCPTVKQQVAAIRASHDLASIAQFSDEWVDVWDQVQELCEDRTPLAEAICVSGWMKEFMPHLPNPFPVGSTPSGSGTGSSQTGTNVWDVQDLDCLGKCRLNEIVCQRDSMPSSITGTNFTVGQHAQAVATVAVCAGAEGACNRVCTACGVCENARAVNNQSLLAEFECDKIQCN